MYLSLSLHIYTYIYIYMYVYTSAGEDHGHLPVRQRHEDAHGRLRSQAGLRGRPLPRRQGVRNKRDIISLS